MMRISYIDALLSFVFLCACSNCRKLMSNLALDYFFTALPEYREFLILAFLRFTPFLPIQNTEEFFKRHTVILKKAKGENGDSDKNDYPPHQILAD